MRHDESQNAPSGGIVGKKATMKRLKGFDYRKPCFYMVTLKRLATLLEYAVMHVLPFFAVLFCLVASQADRQIALATSPTLMSGRRKSPLSMHIGVVALRQLRKHLIPHRQCLLRTTVHGLFPRMKRCLYDSLAVHSNPHLRHLPLLHGLFVAGGCFSLYDSDRTDRAFRQAVANAVAVVILAELCLSAPFVAHSPLLRRAAVMPHAQRAYEIVGHHYCQKRCRGPVYDGKRMA